MGVKQETLKEFSLLDSLQNNMLYKLHLCLPEKHMLDSFPKINLIPYIYVDFWLVFKVYKC